MLAAAESEDRPTTKLVGQLGGGASLTLAPGADGKGVLTFEPTADAPKPAAALPGLPGSECP